jgi:hypothetical protein
MSDEALETRGGHAAGSGSKGTGVAIAGMIVVFCVALPFVTLAVLYMFVTVYAIVRAIGPGAGENPVPIVVGFVLITTTLALMLGITINFVGRSLTPRRQRKRD